MILGNKVALHNSKSEPDLEELVDIPLSRRISTPSLGESMENDLVKLPLNGEHTKKIVRHVAKK